MDHDTLSARARRLGSVLEPVVGQVYFSPECHANYVALGFEPSRGDAAGVAVPDGPAYFTSRGACLGPNVDGLLVASAFGVFKRPMVVAAVAEAKGVPVRWLSVVFMGWSPPARRRTR